MKHNSFGVMTLHYRNARPVILTQRCSQSFGDAFVLTGGREGPKEGELNKVPVGEVVRVYSRCPVMHVCGMMRRSADGWGDRRICLSSKAVYSTDPKHQGSFACGLPDFAELATKYEEKEDGFVIARLLQWQAHQLYPVVEAVHALHRMPQSHQMFVCLAVSHGLDLPLPFAHPRDMFPFEPGQLKQSADAAETPILLDDHVRVDMRHATVFTVDADVTVDLDDAMHCRKLADGNYEVHPSSEPHLRLHSPQPPPNVFTSFRLEFTSQMCRILSVRGHNSMLLHSAGMQPSTCAFPRLSGPCK